MVVIYGMLQLQFHNGFGRVGYVNLTDDQGLFKEHAGDAKGYEEDFKEHEGLPKSMREMPRRVKDAQRMASSCSLLHPYYYGNLQQPTEGYG